jgi:hypothetical protein
MLLRARIAAGLESHGATSAVVAALSGDVTRGNWSSSRVPDDAKTLNVVRLRLTLDPPRRDPLSLAAQARVDSEGEPRGAPSRDLREFNVQFRWRPCEPTLGRTGEAWGATEANTATDRGLPQPTFDA